MTLTLKNVAGFERPVGAAEDDPRVGEDDLGNPIYMMKSGRQYTVKLAMDQRTTRKKIEDTLSGGLRMPTLREVGDLAVGMAKGVGEIIDTPRAIAAGEQYPTIGSGFEVGGMAAVGTLPFSVPAGAQRIFGGLSAKTANKENFVKFAVGLKKNKNPEELWKELGWLKDENGTPRFEIDDSGANYSNAPAGQYVELEKVLFHSELYDAYPSLKGVRITEGTWLDDDHYGYMNFQSDGTPYIVLNTNLTDEMKKSVLLHELNHVVQSIEYPNFEKIYELQSQRNGYFSNPFEIESLEVERRSRMTKQERSQSFPNLKEVGEIP